MIPRRSVNGLLLAAPGLPRVLAGAVRPPDLLGLYRLCAYAVAQATPSPRLLHDHDTRTASPWRYATAAITAAAMSTHDPDAPLVTVETRPPRNPHQAD